MLFIEAELMDVPSISGSMMPGEGRPVWPVKALLPSLESKIDGECCYSGCPHQTSPFVCVLTWDLCGECRHIGDECIFPYELQHWWAIYIYVYIDMNQLTSFKTITHTIQTPIIYSFQDHFMYIKLNAF